MSDIHNESNISFCADCMDPASTCNNCSWQLINLDDSFSYCVYTALDEETSKPQNSSIQSTNDMNKLDTVICGDTPTSTALTLTPTILHNIAPDINILSPKTYEDFDATGTLDLHNLVSSSCTTLNVSSSENSDNLSSDLQDRHTLHNLGIQHLNFQNVNYQHINLDDQQSINQNSLNQQQRNDYNNYYSSATFTQVDFVPPLVSQISSSNTIQSTGVSNYSAASNSIFNAKRRSSTTATSSHCRQEAIMTQRSQSQTHSATKRRFTDDNDYASDYGPDSNASTSIKITQKQNSEKNSKTMVNSESESTANWANCGRRTNNKDNKILDTVICGDIPTSTAPTLTPTILHNIAPDINILSPKTYEDFDATGALDLHNLVSSSCTTLNVSSSENSDNLSSDLQDRHTLHNLGIQHLNFQNVNYQHINLDDQQSINQNSLNQQQRNDYNNYYSSATFTQVDFVPPLVSQISSSNTIQSTGVSNYSAASNSIFNAKRRSSTTATSSHCRQEAIMTQRSQSQTHSATKRRFTDDNDYASDYGPDSNASTSIKITQKQNSEKNSKTMVNSESESTANWANCGRRTNNKDNKIMLAEEEQHLQIRRERNKQAAARCRKRKVDQLNHLLTKAERLEEEKSRLQVIIQSLSQHYTYLQEMFSQHKCNMNNGSVSNSGSTVNHTTTVLDSNDISECGTSVLSNNMPTTKRNPLQQKKINTNLNSDNNSKNGGDITIQNYDIDNNDNIDITPTTVLQQPQTRRTTNLLQLKNGNFSNEKVPGKISTGMVDGSFEI